MNTLYHSDDFIVNHLMAGAEGDSLPDDMALRPAPSHQGFEIVDKRLGKGSYLNGPWAELFQQRLTQWQASAPTQEEVEDTLAQYAELGSISLHMH